MTKSTQLRLTEDLSATARRVKVSESGAETVPQKGVATESTTRTRSALHDVLWLKTFLLTYGIDARVENVRSRLLIQRAPANEFGQTGNVRYRVFVPSQFIETLTAWSLLKLARSIVTQTRQLLSKPREQLNEIGSQHEQDTGPQQLSLFSPPNRVRSAEQQTPAEDLTALWQSLRFEYFPERPDIDEYQVRWSDRRHTRCLASCNVYDRRVQVARAMAQSEARSHLAALVYHEMCHAVLGIPKIVGGRRVIHGRDFKLLEKRHPGIKALDAFIVSGGWKKAVVLQERQKRKQKSVFQVAR